MNALFDDFNMFAKAEKELWDTIEKFRELSGEYNLYISAKNIILFNTTIKCCFGK